MKICGKCGAHQSDDRSTCLDCGAILGRPLSESEERELNEDISDTLTGMSERTEDFYVSPLDRVLGIAAIVLAVAMVILLNVYSVQKNNLKSDLPSGPDKWKTAPAGWSARLRSLQAVPSLR